MELALPKSRVARDLESGNGINVYRTQHGVKVVMLHYSACHDLDTEEGQTWLRKQLAKGYVGGMTGDAWQQEMEMRFSVSGGERVFPDWIDKYLPSVSCEPFEIEEHWPIYAGYDYGTYSPFAFVAVAWKSENEFYQFDEIYLKGKSVGEQAELIRSRPYYARIQGIIGDPAIWHRNQNALNLQGSPVLRSVGGMFQDDYGIDIERGRNDEGVDITFRNWLLSTAWKNLDEPQFRIFSTCTNTLREFRKLRRKEWATPGVAERNEAPEGILNKENHAWDALKYLLLSRQGESPESLPPPVGSLDWMLHKMRLKKRQAQAILA